MSERILVAVAWPYANGSIHIGHVAGAYLPADVFARYHRMIGNQVLIVSGCDAHGTPVTLAAEQRGIPTQQLVESYQAEYLDNWQRFGISFDLFTSTHTDNHAEVAQRMFLRLHEGGYIYPKEMQQPYCLKDARFLADRYVEGKCPHCGFDPARGDQCDNCGRTLDPQDLIGIRCRLCGETPEFRTTEHFFLKLSAFEGQLLEWVRQQSHWRPAVKNFTTGFLEGGLHDRAITRDIEWGVPVPLEGYDGKKLYVWFEAVCGYLSASVEWAASSGNPDAWKDYWQKDCKAYYFLGKDNIPFHTIVWPAMLMGYGGLNLPYDVPANEYLNIEGFKLSTSRNWAVWLPEYLNTYEPDPLRYVIAANFPETSDSDFSWREYVRRNNDELVATYGNLVHRVMTMVNRNFEGVVPDPGEIDPASQKLLEFTEAKLGEVGESIAAVKLRNALTAGMSIAQEANRYLNDKAPWQAVKGDRADAGRTLWTGLTVINAIKVGLYPFLPFSSEKIHAMLGFSGSCEANGWRWKADDLRPGQKLQEPVPLFAKLDEKIIEAETERIGR
jgi:methionyl-tRNA synthetase